MAVSLRELYRQARRFDVRLVAGGAGLVVGVGLVRPGIHRGLTYVLASNSRTNVPEHMLVS